MSHSYSSIDAAQKCLQYYKYVYIDKIKPEEKDSAALHFGTALHMGLEQVLLGNDYHSPFQIYWDTLKDKDLQYGRFDTWDNLAATGPLFLDRFKRLHAKKYEIFSLEKRLYTKLDKFHVEGTPDFVGNYEGVPSVVDFKTSAYPYDRAKGECNEQMYFYAYLAQQALKYEAQQLVYVVFVKGKDPRIQVLKYPLTSEKLESMLVNVKAWIQDLSERTEFLKNRRGCLMGTYKCSFWEKCYGK